MLKMVYYEHSEGKEGSVHQTYHFQDTDYQMTFLQTQAACMPLLLAGTTVSERGIVVELGPFTGLTSKCVAMGLNKASSPRDNALVSYDTFEGYQNHKKISKSSWVRSRYPEFTEENTDFLPLWKDFVQYVYPTAVGRKGYVSPDTLNDKILGEKNIEIMIIDSVKSPLQLHAQLGGVSIPSGSVLFFMDMEHVAPQVLQIFGCFRSGFMVPIYASLGQQHWAFLVTKSFNVNQPWVKKCYTNIQNDLPRATDIINQQLHDDIEFLASGLTGDAQQRAQDNFGYWMEQLPNNLQAKFEKTQEFIWKPLIESDYFKQ